MPIRHHRDTRTALLALAALCLALLPLHGALMASHADEQARSSQHHDAVPPACCAGTAAICVLACAATPAVFALWMPASSPKALQKALTIMNHPAGIIPELPEPPPRPVV